MDDDDEEHREPPLDSRTPDYFPDSFWPSPPPRLMHLEQDHFSAYFEDDEGSMLLGEFGWNLHADDSRKYQLGEFDPFGEACSTSSISVPIDGGGDTSASVMAATCSTTATATMPKESIEEIPEEEEEEEESENKPSLEIA